MKPIEMNASVLINGEEVSSISVQEIFYAGFAKVWARSQLKVSKSLSAETSLQRERIRSQAHFMVKDKRVVPDDAAITQLPIPVARQIIAALNDDHGTAGEVLNDGDGISKPILYRLGNPIKLTGKGETAEIAELEFLAKVYGDVEDVLAADNTLSQTVELIRSVAKPVGVASLTSLPSWALDRISLADGVIISQRILPGFLG